MVRIKKIIAKIDSCNNCPYRQYYDFDVSVCLKYDGEKLETSYVGSYPIVNEDIPEWCPLEDYNV